MKFTPRNQVSVVAHPIPHHEDATKVASYLIQGENGAPNRVMAAEHFEAQYEPAKVRASTGKKVGRKSNAEKAALAAGSETVAATAPVAPPKLAPVAPPKPVI